MAAPRPWSSLHEDLLRRIILLLTCIADRVRASAVNKHGRLVALQNPSPLPCLVRPSTTLTESYRIFGRFPDPRPSLSTEGRAERFCGSAPGGWFVVASPHGRGHALLNLGTGERVALPDRVCIPINSGDIRCPMMIRAAAISAAPSSGACVVAAITSTRTTMAFCRPGMECWTSLPAKMTARPNAQDLTYHDGWFWAVDSDDDLFCYKAELSTSRQTILHLAYGIGAPRTDMAHGEIVSRYLLPSASGADLLMVRRFISPATGRTSRFQVFRLQKAQEGRPASWRVYKMTRQLLFVGRACSKAFDTGHAGNPGYIYFLDDVYPGGPHQQNQYPCADAGGWGYSIPGEIQRCLPSAPPSDTSSCIWYHH
ncbi:hypothetical protein CFC21_001145 [Triticum aestivum]|uniref:KIB1-4 beta-propeller domain-containing protein n=1 Tax=Triticum aestivum TaxID=4565 RepID=A0A3B5XW37_WHEAT|nr:uncharacterized protein LOC123106338 [Triticum aestivum]KAF6982802.1 hypothetical protein CFC21_001145 [Triticum aestivum]